MDFLEVPLSNGVGRTLPEISTTRLLSVQNVFEHVRLGGYLWMGSNLIIVMKICERLANQTRFDPVQEIAHLNKINH